MKKSFDLNLKINKIPKFIKRLYKVVNEPTIKEIYWNDNGNSIIIPKKEEFIKNVLCLVSKTREYSGFIRQLNNYGFTKVRGYTDECEEYFNKNFLRNREELLNLIGRSKEKSGSTADIMNSYRQECYSLRNNVEYLNNSNYMLTKEVENLKARMEKQDRTMNGLIEVLTRAFRFGMKNENPQLAFSENKTHSELDKFLSEDLVDSSYELNTINQPVKNTISSDITSYGLNSINSPVQNAISPDIKNMILKQNETTKYNNKSHKSAPLNHILAEEEHRNNTIQNPAINSTPSPLFDMPIFQSSKETTPNHQKRNKRKSQDKDILENDLDFDDIF
ncbi:heat shock factor-type DNA-binding protein [Hamiltosporidium tvaerminnensis]|uniref:Heat shock factor-type DNA-binding protein n=1 Tax=Hamiltosporidium tvaerminnensis TaxID=1176355 RepID=A0A4Q9L0R8_9MICR|nr:heat shock factor-type DNA-binding protein [Hamiltosporidium tvaerminnensis]